MKIKRILDAFDLTGEDPRIVSAVSHQSFKFLRTFFGIILLYDSWTSMTLIHKLAMAQIMGLPLSSPWLHVTVIALAFLKITIAVSLLADRGVRVTGWLGVAYSLFVALFIEHGGDFGISGTDAGVGAAYMVAFLFVLAAEDARKSPLPQNGLFSLARVTFGILWAYDALFKWQPHFLAHYLDYITNAAKASSGWQATYDKFWVFLSITIGTKLVAVLVAVLESLTAYGLLAGHRFLRIIAPISAALAFVIWTVPERFGGPYIEGVSAMPDQLFGTAIIYLLALGFICVAYNPVEFFKRRDASLEVSQQDKGCT